MTYRDFFRVAIKLFALFILVSSLMSLFSYNVIAVLQYLELNTALLVSSFSIVLVGLYVMLIKKPDAIINLLSLDKGFDNEKIFTEKSSAKDILKMGVIVIGLYIIIINISFFIQTLLQYFVVKNQYSELLQADSFNFYGSGIQLVTGAIFIALRDKIAGLFESSEIEPEEL